MKRRDVEGNPPLSAPKMANKETVEDLDYAGKRVLMRVDYNVPMDEAKNITDTARVDQTLDTIRYILEDKGKRGKAKCLVLIAHLGRPAGDFDKSEFTLQPVAKYLQSQFPERKVVFADDCASDKTIELTKSVPEGTIILCENLRFYMEETGSGLTKDKKKIKATKEQVDAFRGRLSQLGDCLVFEAFGAAHRPHASVVGINHKHRVAGLLMGRELKVYSQLFAAPQRPFLAIVGGSKVSDKTAVLENLLDMVDEVAIGGAMAYSFLKISQGVNIGSSLFDKDSVDTVKSILEKAKAKGVKLILPVDHVIGSGFSESCNVGATNNDVGIPDGWMGLDIGPKSREAIANAVARSKTIVFNGSVGVAEWGSFSAGTLAVLNAMVLATRAGAVTIVGGGDTGAASAKFYFADKPVSKQLTHVSTGGGSSLTLLEGKTLDGVEALSDRA